jgi:hypothetical protein
VSASTRGADDEILVLTTSGGCFGTEIEAAVFGYDTFDNDTKTNPTPAASAGFVTVVCEGAGGKAGPRGYLEMRVADVVRTQKWADGEASWQAIMRTATEGGHK